MITIPELDDPKLFIAVQPKEYDEWPSVRGTTLRVGIYRRTYFLHPKLSYPSFQYDQPWRVVSTFTGEEGLQAAVDTVYQDFLAQREARKLSESIQASAIAKLAPRNRK
jgi:hypothetical protein